MFPTPPFPACVPHVPSPLSGPRERRRSFAHRTPHQPTTVTRSTALAAERHLKLVRPDRDEIADAVRELNARLDAPVQVDTFEHRPCPYSTLLNAYIYRGGGGLDTTVRLPAVADDDEIHDDVRALIAKVQRKMQERRGL